MGFRVKVKNYRSLGNVEIRISGFTVIVGKNNLGKSNLWRAIHGLFHNRPGSGKYIRRGSGAPTCSVEVHFDDGNFVCWEKSEQINTYNINGQHFEKVGRTTPEEMQKLGVGPILISGEAWSPQFAQAVSGQLFLVDKPGSVLAEAISDVDSVARINEALKLSEKDRRLSQSKIKIRRKDLEDSNRRLSLFSGLDEISGDFESLKTVRDGLINQASEVQEILSLFADLSKVRKIHSDLLPVRSISLGDPQDLLDLVLVLDETQELYVLFSESKAQVKSLSNVRNERVPEKKFLILLEKDLAFALKMRKRRDHLRKVLGEERDSGFPEMEKLLEDPGIDLCVKVERGLRTYEELLKEIVAARGTRDRLIEEVSNSQNELQECQESLEKILQVAGSCPVCGQDVNEEHSLHL